MKKLAESLIARAKRLIQNAAKLNWMKNLRALCAERAGTIRYYGILIIALAFLGTAAYRYRDMRAQPAKSAEIPRGQSVAVQITPAPTEEPPIPPLLPTGVIVAPFSITMKPNAASSSVLFSSSPQPPQGLPHSGFSTFLYFVPTTMRGL